MLAVSGMIVLWWHWIILGFILLILEMNTGTFVMFGLGISAIIVGLLDLVLNLTFAYQILLWVVLSVVIIVSWKKWIKPAQVSDTGQSDYNFDTLGSVIEEIHPHKRGKVTFDTPVLGNTSWLATANEIIKVGTRIKIEDINGQLITVKPI